MHLITAVSFGFTLGRSSPTKQQPKKVRKRNGIIAQGRHSQSNNHTLVCVCVHLNHGLWLRQPTTSTLLLSYPLACFPPISRLRLDLRLHVASTAHEEVGHQISAYMHGLVSDRLPFSGQQGGCDGHLPSPIVENAAAAHFLNPSCPGAPSGRAIPSGALPAFASGFLLHSRRKCPAPCVSARSLQSWFGLDRGPGGLSGCAHLDRFRLFRPFSPLRASCASRRSDHRSRLRLRYCKISH